MAEPCPACGELPQPDVEVRLGAPIMDLDIVDALVELEVLDERQPYGEGDIDIYTIAVPRGSVRVYTMKTDA